MSAREAKASNWVAERAEATASAFVLKGSSKSYTSFSRAFTAGDTVFYSAHDEQGNREAGYGVFDGSTGITRNPTATLFNNVYDHHSPARVNFSGEVTVACTFNAAAFNVLWKALDAIDPDGDGGINIPPELIEGLVDTLNSKADQVDLEKEIQDRIDGDKALQDQIDALDPDGDRKVDWSEIEGKPDKFPPEAHGHDISDVDGLQDALDSAGGTPAWDDVTGKPTEFPPSSHGHAWGEITGKPTEFPPAAHDQGWDTITGTPSEYPPSAHGHEIAEINGLQDALDSAGGTPAWNDVTGKPTEFPPEDHTHEQGDIDGLEDRLDAIEGSITDGGGFVDAPDDGKLYGRQSEAWSEVVIPDAVDPDWSDVQNKPTEFPPSAHDHEIAEINGLDAALNDAGKPPTWGEVTGKPSDFPPSSHTHLAADITDFDPADYQPVGDYIAEAPEDGKQYARKDAGWSEVQATGGSSLWEQNGNDIYYNDGNVGIGANNPFSLLDVSSGTNTDGTDVTITLGGTAANTRQSLITKKIQSSGRALEFYAASGGSPEEIRFFRDNANETMRLDKSGRVGIGGEPARSAGEYLEQAKTKIAGWKTTFDDRLKAEPKSDKKAVTLEVTDGDFSVFPTAEALADKLAERAIGGGNAKLQVAGDGYFSGTIYGNVDDVPSHVKNITPTQIANWDAGTGGGGGGGAAIDGRISDTQIANWDQAYGWGNHASAGYQPAGSYAASNHNHSGVYQPAGNYALVGVSYTKAESDNKYELKGAGGLPAGDWACSGSITATGNITAYYSSDERLKDDITAMPVGLIDSIDPVTWKWKEGGKSSGGVVAQQLQACGLDDWVNEAPNGDLGVDYNALIGMLIAEVKSLKAEIAEMK